MSYFSFFFLSQWKILIFRRDTQNNNSHHSLKSTITALQNHFDSNKKKWFKKQNRLIAHELYKLNGANILNEFFLELWILYPPKYNLDKCFTLNFGDFQKIRTNFYEFVLSLNIWLKCLTKLSINLVIIDVIFSNSKFEIGNRVTKLLLDYFSKQLRYLLQLALILHGYFCWKWFSTSTYGWNY
jgi:hypothetical protein